MDNNLNELLDDVEADLEMYGQLSERTLAGMRSQIGAPHKGRSAYQLAHEVATGHRWCFGCCAKAVDAS